MYSINEWGEGEEEIRTMTTKAVVWWDGLGWGGLLFPAVQQYRTIAVPVPAAYD
jgi:hypothetical protein